MRVLYPEIKPRTTFYLDVERPHRIYVEESGNPDGVPVIFIHGGPGSGTELYHSRFFNPDIYRIILFDQRGSGKSTPHADLSNNTTQALVSDMEKIRVHLGIERWVLFGGSWGSTLALVYAETHPERSMALIVRGIFLCRPKEISWFYQEGASRLFPDYWEDYLAPVDVSKRHDMVNAYYALLTSQDETIRLNAAKAWSIWEGRTATLLGRKQVVDHFSDAHVALSLARIECHYFVNNSFLEDNQILRDAYRLADIPGTIVHGRYDVVCPLDNAWDLHHAWPNAELEIVPDAGHAASEPGIIDRLVTAADKYGKMFSR